MLIKKHFDFDLPNAVEEEQNLSDAKRRIAEATKLVTVRIGDGQLVKKHNVWYGFVRNLIGGSIYGSLFCVSNIVIALSLPNKAILIWASSVLLLLYVVVFLFRRAILVQNGEAYAKQLISEFIIQG